jgi:hypothetical protein
MQDEKTFTNCNSCGYDRLCYVMHFDKAPDECYCIQCFISVTNDLNEVDEPTN